MAIDVALPPLGLPPQTLALFIVCGVVSLVLCYRWALPKPIPDIPYNKEALKSIFGDASSMVEATKKTQEMFAWMMEQNVKQDSPIVQLFIRPCSKPWVVITDFREAQDIMVRRTKEFDRSKFFRDVSGAISPKSHFCMPTNSDFRQHRKWLQGTMGIGFLHDTASPHIYEAGLDLLQLWEQKARLAKGHPFTAADDLYRTAMDAVWAILFGADTDNSTTKAQLKLYSSIKSIDIENDLNSPVELPLAPYPAAVQSVLTLTESVETSIKSPVPILAHWVLRQTSKMKKAYKEKDKFIGDEINKAVKRALNKDGDNNITCAIDDFVRREMLLAEKEKRKPETQGQGMSDEVIARHPSWLQFEGPQANQYPIDSRIHYGSSRHYCNSYFMGTQESRRQS
jgi:hypothetical protein